MKKTRMISVIAASLLTATVVFTGCGGGGSSTTASNGSGASSSASSSSSQVTIKTVKVSDGYVFQATVKCQDEQGNDIAQAIATQNPGEYEFSLSSSCSVLVATDGYIDTNANNQLDQGEPKAPTMMAPGSYSNINPFTMLIQKGMTPQEVASAFNLQTADFDIAIPEASLEVQKAAIKLAVVLSYFENSQSSNTRDCLPGTPCDNGSSSSEEAADANQPATIASLDDFIAALKSGKKFDEVVPQDVQTVVDNIENATTYMEAEQQAKEFLASINGCYGECGSSSSEATSSSEASSTGGTGAFPGETGSETSNSSETSSSSEATSSSEASSTGGTGETGDFPGA